LIRRVRVPYIAAKTALEGTVELQLIDQVFTHFGHQHRATASAGHGAVMLSDTLTVPAGATKLCPFLVLRTGETFLVCALGPCIPVVSQ
jgi:hypothetical protein